MLFNFVNGLKVSHVLEFLNWTLWIQRWKFKFPLDWHYVLVLVYWTLILVNLLRGWKDHDTWASDTSLLGIAALLLAHSDHILLVNQILLVLGCVLDIGCRTIVVGILKGKALLTRTFIYHVVARLRGMLRRIALFLRRIEGFYRASILKVLQ